MSMKECIPDWLLLRHIVILLTSLGQPKTLISVKFPLAPIGVLAQPQIDTSGGGW
jgi:hypothetical protein